jgi:hypothetical protein
MDAPVLTLPSEISVTDGTAVTFAAAATDARDGAGHLTDGAFALLEPRGALEPR